MKASELAEIIMKFPDFEVYVDYMPYNAPYDEGDNFTIDININRKSIILES